MDRSEIKSMILSRLEDGAKIAQSLRKKLPVNVREFYEIMEELKSDGYVKEEIIMNSTFLCNQRRYTLVNR